MSNKNILYVIFGLPGTGKTYVGKLLKKYFGFYFYEGDRNLSREMRQALNQEIPLTDEMRGAFFNRLISSVKKLKNKYTKIVVAQTFIKEKYRRWFLDEFPDAQFLLVKTEDKIRKDRLLKRKYMELDLEYSRQMCANFERPKIKHFIITNNLQGERRLLEQINLFFSNFF